MFILLILSLIILNLIISLSSTPSSLSLSSSLSSSSLLPSSFLSSTFFPLSRSSASSLLLELLAPLPSFLSFPLFYHHSLRLHCYSFHYCYYHFRLHYCHFPSFPYPSLRYYYRERSYQQEYFHQGKIYQQYVKVQPLQEQWRGQLEAAVQERKRHSDGYISTDAFKDPLYLEMGKMRNF